MQSTSAKQYSIMTSKAVFNALSTKCRIGRDNSHLAFLKAHSYDEPAFG